MIYEYSGRFCTPILEIGVIPNKNIQAEKIDEVRRFRSEGHSIDEISRITSHTKRTGKTYREYPQSLCKRFDTIDFRQAKEDVAPFIRDTVSLSMWNADFFKKITAGLQF